MPRSARSQSITPQELKDDFQFQEIKVLKHDDLIPFVQEQYQNKTYILQLFIFLNFFLIVVLFGWGTYVLLKTAYTFGTLLAWTGIGVALSFSIFIVIHEWIHGIAYKWMGAPRISYGGNLKKFYFYAAADQFVVNQGQLIIIALAPFVAISTAILVALFFVDIPASFLLLGLLFMHTTMCGGDFGMINFLLNQEHPVYTYDDMAKKTSWFYQKMS